MPDADPEKIFSTEQENTYDYFSAIHFPFHDRWTNGVQQYTQLSPQYRDIPYGIVFGVRPPNHEPLPQERG
ncbi:MAG: hypothetical protein OXG94_09065, partial [Bacteroidetes bacterium]|nr:hypothetical protein [Bacteroidota bacterium]